MHVIGTAGHVDHGKTSLLRHLTGMEPSRLASERARGLSTQLGFVWMPGPDGRPIGVVDVPGHADYRLHTLTGAGAFDAFLFVCACDDGWMPQSEEHLWALAAYGIDHGVVVLTKSDLVNNDRLASLTAEMEVRFFEALGREIPVIGFSATTNPDTAPINKLLFTELRDLPAIQDCGRPQMFVDRVFTVAGQGTVVTGTLRDGTLSERQVISIQPSGKKAQIRSIQCYGQAVKTADPNVRVALQLANVGVADVPKDSQIADPAQIYLTSSIDIRLRLFPGAHINPKKSPHIIVMHGGVKTEGKMIAIAALDSSRDSSWHVRIKLALPRLIRFDERCLIVSSGADKVIGAGRIVDEAPKTSTSAAAPLLASIHAFSQEEHLALNLAKSGAVRQRDLTLRTRFPALGPTKDFFILGAWLTEKSRVKEWQDAILALIEKRHRLAPMDDGLAESALVKSLRIDTDLVHALVAQLKTDGRIEQVGPYLKIFGYTPRADHTSAFVTQLERLAQDAKPVLLSHFDLGIDTDEKRRIVARFVSDQKLVRLDEKHLMSGPAFRSLASQVAAHITQSGPATAAAIRDNLQLGRKLVVLLLEAMDHAKITVRSGEHRILSAPNT